MKRLSLFLIISIPLLIIPLAGLSSTAKGSPGRSQSLVITDTIPAEIYSGRRYRYGILGFDHQGIFGPHICTEYGDPFSPTVDPDGQPLRDVWRENPDDTSYHYQFKIPPDYPDDVVRVELFDPDTINRENNLGSSSYQADVVHTDIALQNGMPAMELLSCTSLQVDPCRIDTNEDSLGLDLDLVNLWWFARVDESRGTGGPTGFCLTPLLYNEFRSTITFYELFYYKLNNGTSERVSLAWYYGQSGHLVVSDYGFPRDLTFSSYNHETDIRWVTPGGQLSFDQPVAVPTGCGSPNGGDFDPVTCPGGTMPGVGNGFEIEIANDLIDIILDEAGNRNLYLDVTTLSGSSENGYDIWAGPNDYVNTLASDANFRNVAILNNPDIHDNLGIETVALGDKLTNSTYDAVIDIALGYVGPEYAGQSVYVSIFDSDAGTQPPIHFSFDTIAQDDYFLTFSNPPEPDPDGETGRCILGDCSDQFIDPPYRIDIPTLSDACTDPNDPDQMMVCTPFYGGRLIATHDGSLNDNDTYLWHMRLPEEANGSPTAGCTAFPITVEQGVQTVTEATYNASIYPAFTYPTGSNRPNYDEFTEQPPIGTDPLLDNIEGQVFVLNYAAFTPQSFDWLKWNTYITGLSSGNLLAASLAYPGNSHDYTNHNDLPAAPPPDNWGHTYRGFAEVNNLLDKEMHLDDYIARDSSSGGFGGFGVTAALNDHIDTGRTLRLPLWDHSSGTSGGSQYQASGFGLFRILGYNTNNWLLMELVGLDESCGQPASATAITLANIAEPVTTSQEVQILLFFLLAATAGTLFILRRARK
jgi:hypothetical protein